MRHINKIIAAALIGCLSLFTIETANAQFAGGAGLNSAKIINTPSITVNGDNSLGVGQNHNIDFGADDSYVFGINRIISQSRTFRVGWGSAGTNPEFQMDENDFIVNTADIFRVNPQSEFNNDVDVNADLTVSGTADFNGNVNVMGTFTASSDKRFKSEIETLENSLEKVMRLNAVSYKFKIDEFTDYNLASGTHMGYIAQELEKIYPSTVYNNENGFKSVAYLELIPVLTGAIQEQQMQIEALQNQVEQLLGIEEPNNSGSNGNDDFFDLDNSQGRLFQNTPNPFNEETVIRYETERPAQIILTDMEGNQLQRLNAPIEGRKVILSAGSLTSGTYLYTLMVEGKRIDSKRLVINK